MRGSHVHQGMGQELRAEITIQATQCQSILLSGSIQALKRENMPMHFMWQAWLALGCFHQQPSASWQNLKKIPPDGSWYMHADVHMVTSCEECLLNHFCHAGIGLAGVCQRQAGRSATGKSLTNVDALNDDQYLQALLAKGTWPNCVSMLSTKSACFLVMMSWS